jgi:hypothetical protein
MDNKNTSNYHVEDVKTSVRRLVMCHSVYECHVLIEANKYYLEITNINLISKSQIAMMFCEA